ncbi:MAG: hypothetical protein NWR12_10775, partial [Haliea sp.]|nr:hypothetical protein [Haliea sp.]
SGPAVAAAAGSSIQSKFGSTAPANARSGSWLAVCAGGFFAEWLNMLVSLVRGVLGHSDRGQ